MKKLAILLAVHNRADCTLRCLSSIYNQNGADIYEIDIFLTDDASTDRTYELVREKFPDVYIFKGTGNLYWNRGMRYSWEMAVKHNRYDYFLWLNDDTEIFPETISELVNSSLTTNDESIMVGTTISKNNSSQVTYGGRTFKAGLITPAGGLIKCDYFNGNIVLIPYSVFIKVGYNDNKFHHALGDFDYGLRASKVGITSYVTPSTLGVCEEHEGLPKWCDPIETLSGRWRQFRTPLGHNPEEYFIYEYRHHGLIAAIYHYLTNHLRVFFPSLWNFKNNQN